MHRAIGHDLSGEWRTSDVAAGPMTSFKPLKLRDEIMIALHKHKFVTPTRIQAAAIPVALSEIDLLVQSKSGTGKTLIFVLAALQSLKDKTRKPHALVIVPTRELAVQVKDTLNDMGEQIKGFEAVHFFGGTELGRDRHRAVTGRVIVGTPGRLLHLMQINCLDTSEIQLLVLDEADQLYGQDGMQSTVASIIRLLPAKRQIIACSATYENSLDEKLAKLMQKPVLISNSERATVLLGVRQFVLELPAQVNKMLEMKAKIAALHRIFEQLTYQQCIIFASSQLRADSFTNYLRADGLQCELMSGALPQNERLVTFQGYRNFTVRTIVSTDVFSRGVDSSHANLVINIDLPKDYVSYLHRIGRAGRFGAQGIAITILSSPQQRKEFREMIANAGTGMSVLYFPEKNIEGYDFWNFDSYKFPYFMKPDVPEQKNASKPMAQEHPQKPKGNAISDINAHIENNNKKKTIVMEPSQHLESYSDEEKLKAEINKLNKPKSVNTSQPHHEIEHKSSEISPSAEQITERESLEKSKLENQKATPQVTQADHHREINSIDRISSIDVPIEKSKRNETRLMKSLQEIDTIYQELEKNAAELLSAVENKENRSNPNLPESNQKRTRDISKIGLNPKEGENDELVPQIAEPTPPPPPLLIQPAEDIESAATTSEIDNKTYCLAVPTEQSSTTLMPLAISNTVDDASSIISDSIENGYASDGSYVSYFSESDEKVIWQRYKSQEKFKKMHRYTSKRLKKRRIRLKKMVIETSYQDEEEKDIINIDMSEEIDEDVDLTNPKNNKFNPVMNINETDNQYLKPLKKKGDFKMNQTLKTPKISSKDFALPLILAGRRNLLLLEKFENHNRIRQRLHLYIKQCGWSIAQTHSWLDQLYEAAQYLYYRDHNKSKPLQPMMRAAQLSESSEPIHYNSPAEWYAQKLSVHVNEQVNIAPVIADRVEAGGGGGIVFAADLANEESYDEDTETSSSHTRPEDDLDYESTAPSSSGFVESNESASSGIDTSQYSTNSSLPLSSYTEEEYEDEYEEEEEEDEDDLDEDGNESSMRLTGPSSQGSGTDSDSENTLSENDQIGNRLALDRHRWEQIYQNQLRFIYDYVASCTNSH
ncbi:probable ATP-dependent RNA helicase DDX20 isoform X2 [Scaptodrosophila lebanonensis]|uniref:RNA helicase n=1 Tax=Drosophila lebanonensis TaxID=7225 RepID=A0A6J2T7P8_DROLE|nr:probable ATP-dependent RNA helicase DDX20 isoform X2 [Scaptodrosophila lebanonensis]